MFASPFLVLAASLVILPAAPAFSQYQELRTSNSPVPAVEIAEAVSPAEPEAPADADEPVPAAENPPPPQASEAGESDACPAELEAYLQTRSVEFRSGSAVPTQASLAMLPGIAEILALCPLNSLHVEGHTDSVGSDAINLTLSVRRAEAVVDALIGLGIAPERLYAVGYGASLPIASNQTAEGRAANRRIVFSFEDPAAPVTP